MDKLKTVKTEDLAVLLGLSPRRIQQLAESGVIERAERGLYLLEKSVQGYCQFLAEAAKSKPIDAETLAKLRKEQYLKTCEERRSIKMQNDLTEGMLTTKHDARLVLREYHNEHKRLCKGWLQIALSSEPGLTAEKKQKADSCLVDFYNSLADIRV